MHIAQANEPSNIPQREKKTATAPSRESGFQAAFETESGAEHSQADHRKKADEDTQQAPELMPGALAQIPPRPDAPDPAKADAPARHNAAVLAQGAAASPPPGEESRPVAGAKDGPAQPPAAPAPPSVADATGKTQTSPPPVPPADRAGESTGWVQLQQASGVAPPGDGPAPDAVGGRKGAAIKPGQLAEGATLQPDPGPPRTEVPDITAGALRAEAAAPPRSEATSVLASLPDIPRGIARQIAETLQRLPDGPVEVALRPEELGHVRITLATRDDAIHVTIQAERPETADLMRRHIDALANEFRGLGYRDVGFDFGQAAGNARQGRPDPHTNAPPVSPAEVIEMPVNRGAEDRLDLRL